ncbi:hypothetical protein BD410DRAFT_362447 [Rickenella mellea]|uniref:Uncharacterized protein n=1 Tax=Rickenella mellea TaxID=50990 RepID=A0A4Y7Q1B9_9AGAM|nr:hypothetical protein BD410DRAFT_362447 [Rickenella mellea]
MNSTHKPGSEFDSEITYFGWDCNASLQCSLFSEMSVVGHTCNQESRWELPTPPLVDLTRGPTSNKSDIQLLASLHSLPHAGNQSLKCYLNSRKRKLDQARFRQISLRRYQSLPDSENPGSAEIRVGCSGC